MKRLLLLLFVLSLPLIACDEDPVDVPVESGFLLDIIDRDSGDPQAGVKVVLMDPIANRPVVDPRVSDQTGRLEFTDLEAGVYTLLAFPGNERGVFRTPGEIRLGGDTQAKTSPMPNLEILTWHDPNRFEDELPRISGVVVDAETGEPLPGAFIGEASFADLYAGAYSPKVDVSGPDGAFHVADVLVAQNPFSGNLIQARPLNVQRDGYEPLAWRYHFSNGEDNVDVLGARVEMWKLGSERPFGSLSGQIVFQSAPVPDIEVGLAYYDDPDNPFLTPKSGVGVPGLSVRTDADGRFLIEDIPAGHYLLHPAYRIGDGYMRSPVISAALTVIADSTLSLEPLPVLATIDPIWPTPGCTVRDSLPLWSWSTAVAVDSFRVYLDRCDLGVTTEARFQMTDPCGSGDRQSRFQVEGYLGGEVVAVIEENLEFRFLPDEP